MRKFIIVDNTSNSGNEYITENGENGTEGNAAIFATRKEAENFAQSLTTGQVRNWPEWAGILEIDRYQDLEEELTGEYYGSAELKDSFGNYLLYCAEIADPDEGECGWECAEWSLVSNDDYQTVTLIARCDGYSGIEWILDDDGLLALLGDNELVEQVNNAVRPYTITGELIAAAKEATLDDVDNCDDDVSIWCDVCYYGGTCNAPVSHLLNNADAREATDSKTARNHLNDNDADDVWVGAQDEAQLILNELDSGTYTLSNGEAGRPSYRIVKA